MVALQTQHEPGENSHNRDDGQTHRALFVDRSQNAARQATGFRQGQKRASEKQREVAGIAHDP